MVFTGRVPASVVAGWYGALLLWAAAGSADVRAWLGYRRYVGRGLAGAGLALLPMSALLAASRPDHVAVSVLDVDAPALFVRAGERTMLVTGAAGSGPLAASLAERLGLWERGIDLAVLVDRPELVAETLRRYPASLVVAPSADAVRSGGPAPATPALGGSSVVPQEGQRIDLGEDVWVHVVDVREHADVAVLDVRVVVGEVSVWLPGPGPASARWGEVAEDGRHVLVRLPSRSLAWTRVAPNVPWLAIVGDGLELADRSGTGSTDDADGPRLVLDQRAYGGVELVLAASGWSVRTERCPRGRGCVVVP